MLAATAAGNVVCFSWVDAAMSADEQDTRRARTKTFTATRADKIAAVRFPSIKDWLGSEWLLFVGRKKEVKRAIITFDPTQHVQETFAWHAAHCVGKWPMLQEMVRDAVALGRCPHAHAERSMVWNSVTMSSASYFGGCPAMSVSSFLSR